MNEKTETRRLVAAALLLSFAFITMLIYPKVRGDVEPENDVKVVVVTLSVPNLPLFVWTNHRAKPAADGTIEVSIRGEEDF